jgi:hypothetical protein
VHGRVYLVLFVYGSVKMSDKTWYIEQDSDERWIQDQLRQFEQEQWEAMEEAKRLGAGVQLEFDFEYADKAEGRPF